MIMMKLMVRGLNLRFFSIYGHETIFSFNREKVKAGLRDPTEESEKEGSTK